MTTTQEAAQPDVSEEDASLQDRIAEAVRRRGTVKGVLTRHLNLIDKLTSDRRNIPRVKEKLSAVPECVERFTEAHTDVVRLLSDEKLRSEEEAYSVAVITQAMDLQEGVNNWLAQYEDEDTDQEEAEERVSGDAMKQWCATTRDSIEEENSKLEKELQELAKRTRQRQLELRNLMLKREMEKLIQEDKKLQDELDSYKTVENELEAEGQSLTSCHAESNIPRHPESTGSVPLPQSTPKGTSQTTKRVSWEPSRVSEEFTPADPATAAASALADALKQVLDTSRDQQRTIVESLQVPRGETQTFDGDELDYWPFIRSFKDSIDCLSISAAQKLVYLKQCCRGKAALALKSTSYLDPEEGYKTALKILEERFGNTYNIACKWVKKVVNRPEVRTAADLREYADEVNCCVESLKAMNSICQLESGDNMLKIVENLPYYLKTRWIKTNHEIRSKYKRGANITELVKFICDAADEASDPVFGRLVNKEQKKDKGRNQQSKFQKRQAGSFTTKASITEDRFSASDNRKQIPGKCPCCDQGHYMTRCPQFKSLKIKDRRALVIAKGLCLNCFAHGHLSKDCNRNYGCAVAGCGLKHNTYLHLPNRKPDEDSNSQVPTVTHTPVFTPTPENNSVPPRMINYARSQGGKLALPIVPARVRCTDTKTVIDTYAMLDPGTNATYCTEDLCDKLGARGVTRQMELTTIAQTRMPVESTVITLFVSDIHDKQEPCCIPEVTVRPSLNIDLSGLSSCVELQKWPHLEKLEIPELDVDEVHLLIGQDCADLLLPDEIKKGHPGEPFAIHTPLGWAINGPIDPFKSAVKTSYFVHNRSSLEKDLSRLWELEGVNSEDPGMSQNDIKTLETWDTRKTIEDNHYTLTIPFKAERPYLADNRGMAEKRLRMLGKRLNKDNNLKDRYTEEIHKLLQKGYAESVPPEDLNRADGKVWYLPHHPVHNPKKPDKTRIVFDCAAKYGESSLNDHVCQGPDLTNKLVGVLLRFREGLIAFMADIESMFHQIRVTPDDRDVLRFLWFQEDDTRKQTLVYRMTSHLFGGVWSPSCATYALQQVTKEFEEAFPEIVLSTVRHNFYVDDCLKSVNTLEIAVPLVKQVTQLLSLRGFHLTKFVSNSPELMSSIPKEEWGKSFTTLDNNLNELPTERALGMLWEIGSDCLKVDVQVKNHHKSRRGILSALSSVYDPLGLVSPFVLAARRLFQQLCRQEKEWDEPLTRDVEEQWGRWLNDLLVIKEFRIPRCLMSAEPLVKTVQLHHFSDASEYGYGSVAYLRTVYETQQVSVNLLMAKSRLAPLKGSTIPRLELAAALEAVRLDTLLQKELQMPLENSVYWTDSTIVLWYLQNPEKRFQTYVANRVAKVLEHTTPVQWRYVPTMQNTGDIASRGMTAEELLNEERWSKGPAFLYRDISSWPKQPAFNCAELEEIAEVKRSPVVYTMKTEEDHLGRLFNHYSTWHRMKKAVAWFLRLRQILRKQPYMKGPLVAEEMRAAEEAIIRHAQKVFTYDKPTYLGKLNPKMSASGLLLVGGRLAHSIQEGYAKHQLIIPREHPAAKLIIEDLHRRSGHAGVERVLAETRRRYWIIKGRKLVKEIVHQCITCRKLRGKTEIQQMADLPASRVTPFEPPFTRVGVDYFGPFIVKRGRSNVKRYGCIFTCLSVRAVHIEVSHTLDTDSFINALERFIARRGEPKEIWSDNGTNFVGAQKELHRAIKDWNQDQIHEHLLKKEITWKFNPPEASHMGGVWERQIRTIRRVLAGVVKQQTLDDESLVTLMTIVENIVNGRPITKLSDDPRDERPLTPNHLLMLWTSPMLPTGKFGRGDQYRRRWRQIQYLADIFWRRWMLEYLPTLQERQKWLTPKRNVMRGDLILLKQDHCTRNQWPLGLVTETYPSADGLVRSVAVRTTKGTYERPITKVCLLEGATSELGETPRSGAVPI